MVVVDKGLHMSILKCRNNFKLFEAEWGDLEFLKGKCEDIPLKKAQKCNSELIEVTLSL